MKQSEVRTLKACNALITLGIVVIMISLSLVEEQPLVFCVTIMAALLTYWANELRTMVLADIRSAASEDRPE